MNRVSNELHLNIGAKRENLFRKSNWRCLETNKGETNKTAQNNYFSLDD